MRKFDTLFIITYAFLAMSCSSNNKDTELRLALVEQMKQTLPYLEVVSSKPSSERKGYQEVRLTIEGMTEKTMFHIETFPDIANINIGDKIYVLMDEEPIGGEEYGLKAYLPFNVIKGYVPIDTNIITADNIKHYIPFEIELVKNLIEYLKSQSE